MYVVVSPFVVVTAGPLGSGQGFNFRPPTPCRGVRNKANERVEDLYRFQFAQGFKVPVVVVLPEHGKS